MSIQSAIALYSRLIADDQFKRKLEQAANYDECYQILQVAGFTCTSAELNIAKNQFWRSPDSRSSDKLS
jgi:predicted ribosomally synthesized peptide with nif11-like leader